MKIYNETRVDYYISVCHMLHLKLILVVAYHHHHYVEGSFLYQWKIRFWTNILQVRM